MIGYKKNYYTIDDIKAEMVLLEQERKKINDKRKIWKNICRIKQQIKNPRNK